MHVLYSGTGAISWFPVHCTSINNTNDLISGDNKGVASQFMEKWAAKQSMGTAGGSNPGQLQVAGDFVAAFGQANVGDTSPNIQGAFCQDTGGGLLPCVAFGCVSMWCFRNLVLFGLHTKFIKKSIQKKGNVFLTKSCVLLCLFHQKKFPNKSKTFVKFSALIVTAAKAQDTGICCC